MQTCRQQCRATSTLLIGAAEVGVSFVLQGSLALDLSHSMPQAGYSSTLLLGLGLVVAKPVMVGRAENYCLHHVTSTSHQLYSNTLGLLRGESGG